MTKAQSTEQREYVEIINGKLIKKHIHTNLHWDDKKTHAYNVMSVWKITADSIQISLCECLSVIRRFSCTHM